MDFTTRDEIRTRRCRRLPSSTPCSHRPKCPVCPVKIRTHMHAYCEYLQLQWSRGDAMVRVHAHLEVFLLVTDFVERRVVAAKLVDADLIFLADLFAWCNHGVSAAALPSGVLSANQSISHCLLRGGRRGAWGAARTSASTSCCCASIVVVLCLVEAGACSCPGAFKMTHSIRISLYKNDRTLQVSMRLLLK